jgi:mono/diheme cytochrome c family protein
MRRGFPFLLIALALPISAAPVDFDREVRPVFESHCYSCHGAKKQKSGYRLDRKKEAFAGGESGDVAIAAGQPGGSLLYRAISGAEKDLIMPPKKSDTHPLEPAEIALVRRWIEEGAVWKEQSGGAVAPVVAGTQWSWNPVVKAAVPAGPAGANPVDAFVRAKVRELGLGPSPEADRRTLIRRVSYDLTGLPPTAEEVEAFVGDPDPRAYEKLVDRLLASPRYGERWARHWLDVVHYGESHGYDKDKPRPNSWPYRDYVIRAFNEDKPYARFVQEQLAGDILYSDSADGIAALGFLAAGPWDLIGHMEVPESKTDGLIARHLDRDDMVSNTMNTFCSVTVHCAQCHDHKFDPIKQEDYYSLQAVFAALDRTDRKYFADAQLTRRLHEIEGRRRELEARRGTIEGEARTAAGPRLVELDQQIATLSKAQEAKKPAEHGYHSAIAQTSEEAKWVQVDLGKSQLIDHVTLTACYDDFNGIGAGFGFPVRFKIEASDDPTFASGGVHIADRFSSDVPNPALEPQVFPAAGASGRYVRVTAKRLAPRRNDFIFALAELEVFDAAGKNLAAGAPVTALDSIEAPPRWRKANLVDGIAPSAGNSAELVRARAEREELVARQITPDEQAELAALKEELAALGHEQARFPAPQVVYAGGIHYGTGNFTGTGPNGGKPRVIHVLARGDVRRPGKEAQPGAISSITVLPARFDLPAEGGEAARRAALARWITDPQNPLTWRSIVNRIWQYHFGRGLVETPNDFGKMGAAPTHPELLDWLAATFRDDMGGSLKALHRLIVTSATYRQVSAAPDLSSPAVAKDSDNRFLWRQNPRRLEAEAIRDSILSAAGVLDLSMGGPSYQDFVITHPEHSPHYEYQLADPEDPKTWRRAIYRFIIRSQQQPWMATMDCADPSLLVEKRNVTITPLQALAELNDQLVVAMSRHFAQRVARSGETPEAQMEAAYRFAFQRSPTAAERADLAAFTTQYGLPNACRLLLNLNEFVFVD